jgi:uncharacterized protein YegP (UPF0339 family)
MPGKFELSKTRNGQFVFNLKAANGQVILTSHTYASKDAALTSVESVRQNGSLDNHFDRKTSTGGQPYFSLMAEGGENLGRSEMYSSIAAMEKGIASVKRNAQAARLIDLSDFF